MLLETIRNVPTHTKCKWLLSGTREILIFFKVDAKTNNRIDKLEFPRFSLSKGQWYHLARFIITLEEDLEKKTGITYKREIKFEDTSETDMLTSLSEDPDTIESLYEESLGKLGDVVKIFEKIVDLVDDESNTDRNEQGKPIIRYGHIAEAVKRLNISDLLADDEAIDFKNPPKEWEVDISVKVEEERKEKSEQYEMYIIPPREDQKTVDIDNKGEVLKKY
ncbi:MAG: hypothetical protein ACXAEU_00425 [Candidatus Hodarchaeales archaeon]|jgi:hypothetical protein